MQKKHQVLMDFDSNIEEDTEHCDLLIRFIRMLNLSPEERPVQFYKIQKILAQL